jgi:hypothetical protein
VLSRLNKTEEAELHMRRIEQRHKDHPESGGIMGQVYRDMWRLRWIDQKELGDRQRRAIETSQLAAASIQRYYNAQKRYPEQYFNGFNVLILLAVLKHLTGITGLDAAATDPVDEKELSAVVHFTCRCAHDNAVRAHNYIEQFWTLTTAAGLDMLAGNSTGARQNFRDACNVPDATVFEFHTIRTRLELLQKLGYSGDGAVDDGIRIVDETLSTRTLQHCQCSRVIVFAGCAVDSCAVGAKPVDSRILVRVQEQIEKAVETLVTDKDTLVICGLCHVSDVIFAEACHKRHARVRLLIPRRQGLPTFPCEGFAKFPDWENRAYKLIRDCECWYQDEHLGRTPEGLEDSERNRRWIANTAKMEATLERLHALVLGDPATSYEVAFLEKEIRRSGGEVHRIGIEVTAPLTAVSLA